MIQLARLHAYRNGVFWLVDVPVREASKRRSELRQEGWEVVFSEVV